MEILALLLTSILALAALPERPDLSRALLRRRLGFAAILLLLLAALGPYYVSWRHSVAERAARRVVLALSAAEAHYHKENGEYAGLDRLHALGRSPVREGGRYRGYSFSSTADAAGYALVARPSWRDGQTYTMDQFGILNRQPRPKRELTPAERLAEAQAAVKADPRGAAAWVRLATLWVEKGRAADALAAARRAASLDAAAASQVLRDALLLRGAELLNAGKARKAVPLLQESTRLDARDADALALLGDAYHALGRDSEALGAYHKATEAGAAAARAWYGMARIHESRGRKVEAARAYLRVVDIGDETFVPDKMVNDSMAALDRLHGNRAPR